MTISIDHVVKSRIQMEPNSISPESMMNIVCVGQETKKVEQEESPQKTYSIPLKNHEAQFGLLGVRSQTTEESLLHNPKPIAFNKESRNREP